MADGEVIEENKVKEIDGFFKYKLSKQFCLIGIWISMGLYLEVIGPTIPDMMSNIGINYEEISRALMGISAGYISGSVLGGVIHERFYKYTDLFLSVGVAVATIGTIAVPWMKTLWTLAAAFYCCGLSVALNNAGGNAMVLHLWGKQSGPPMYSLHFGFGLGSFLAPQIARPFLGHHSQENMTLSCELQTNISLNMSDCNETVDSLVDQTGLLVYPFSIIAVINALLSLCMFGYFMCGAPKGFPMRKGSKNIKSLCSLTNCTNIDDRCCGILILTLLFLYYVQAVGAENVYGKWLFSFALETDVEYTKDQASTLNSVFWLCHMGGRGLGIILTKFIPITYIIIADIFGLIVSSIVLTLFGHKLAIVLWIFSGFMGMLLSPLFPAGLLWANLYMNVNSMTVMICILGGSSGFMVYVYASGFMFQYFGPRSVMVIEIICGVVLLLIFTLMEIIGRRIKRQIRHFDVPQDIEVSEISERMISHRKV